MQPPGLLARLAAPARVRAAARWLLGAALLGAVAACAAWVFTRGSLPQRFPGEDALGTPAVGTFRAPRDYEFVDVEATARIREEAAAAAPQVWDYDEGAPEDEVARLRSAFQAARQALAEAERVPAPRRPDALQAAADAFQARIPGLLRPEDAAALGRARYAEPVEQRVAALVAHGLTGMVVEDRDRLLADREWGLVARPLRGGAPQGERLVREPSLVRDLRSARGDLRRDGAGLPAAWPAALRESVVRTAGQLLRPTLSFNLAESVRRQRDAADRVKASVVQVRRGEVVVADGERIERRHLVVFRGIQAQTRPGELLAVRVGGGLLVVLLVLVLWRQARGAGFRPSRRDALLLAGLFLGTLGLAAAGLSAGEALHERFPRFSPEAFYHLVPLAAGAMLARALLSAEVALRFAVASGVAVGLLAGHSLFFAVQAVLTAVAASGLATRGRDRTGLVEAGALVGVLAAALAVAAQLFTGRGLSDAAAPAGFAFLGGALLLPALVAVLLPIAERALGYVTDVRLLELANLSHPALKDLIVQAPGTYHHSVVLGTLAEAAAPAAGASPLLARVCAYYHDIGKIRNPSYFSENQRSDNRLEQLAPSMSALIVKRHVADGIELARRWKLPAPVLDVIAQHHGTRFVSYFWAKARRRAEEGSGPWDDPAAVDEELFRYPGPRPRTREAALVMIADVAEASARAQPELPPERIGALVAKRVDELLAEGQLDECPMTLLELRGAAQAMGRALEGVHRARADDATRPPPEPAGGRPGLQLVAKS
jgi:putative nucleotidyltransferase with HDIG domain